MSKDYYFMQRNTGNTESVTVEYGFLDSKGDDVNQLKNNWQNLAEAVVRAVAQYASIPYSIQNDNVVNSYTVVLGDSLWSIAKKFGITVDDLKNINNLSSNLLKIGQVLNIPLNKNNINYVVKSGDTLYKIASKYNVGVSDIMKLNNLSSNLLSIGQVLLIPSDYSETDDIIYEYIVKSGDTLYKIANIYNVKLDDLIRLNNLASNNLSIGQIIKIPNNTKIYRVESGDTLYKIANKFNTNITDLINKNNLTNTKLNVGQLIEI